MDNFKAVYTILSSLEKSMDLPEANVEMFNAKALGVSEERWKKFPLTCPGRCSLRLLPGYPVLPLW